MIVEPVDIMKRRLASIKHEISVLIAQRDLLDNLIVDVELQMDANAKERGKEIARNPANRPPYEAGDRHM